MLNSPFMVRARALTGFANVVAECGADPARLLRESGLSVSLLDRPDAPIPVVAFAQLLARAAEELQVPDFSLRMAACQDLTVLGAVSLIGLNSATVGEAVLRVGRNLPYHSPALQIQLERSGEQDVLRLINDVKLDAAPMRQLAEHTLLNSTNILRRFSRLPGRDWSVHFRHAAAFPVARYAQFFGCEVVFDQPVEEIRVPASVMDTQIQYANAELRKVGEHYAGALIRYHPLDLGRQVEELIERQLGAGCCNLSVIAEQLDMPSYSLQRRLAALNLRFEDITDKVRRRRAEEMLPLTALPLSRIAECLGYSSQTSFTRSCRRWFGESPQAMRARMNKMIG